MGCSIRELAAHKKFGLARVFGNSPPLFNLRWLKTVSNTFQDLDFDVPL